MKWMYLLPLLLTAASCEKRLNLRDIERDNLRSESRGGGKKSSSAEEQLRADESKYSAKAEVAQQQQYYAPAAAPKAAAAPQELGNQVGDYAELQSYESFKYASGQQQQQQQQQQDYSQENDDASVYLQQSRLVEEQQQQQQQQQHAPQQYYIQEGRSHSQNGYDAHQQQQQQLYQQEVLVGNQLQSVQQKAAAQKYADGSEDKGIYYINIPMSQLLAYYQNYGIVQSKSKNAEQQVPIPIYTPTLTQNQVYTPNKVAYQPKVQYVSAYPKYTQAAIAKALPSIVPNAASPATVTAPVHQIPAASHQQYTAPVEILMAPTYASTYQPQRYQYQYVTEQQQQQPQQYEHQYQQQQQQQQQQIVYDNAANTYQADTYNEPSIAYEQDNFLYEQQHQQQQYQRQPKQQQYYVQPAVSEQLMSQLLHQTALHNSIETPQPHSIKQESSEPLHAEFTPPQYQAQKFRASQEITHLVPVANEHKGFPSKSAYSSASYSPQPKSLLDSYVPSHVIAAQDSHRYRERPIKLESGFLPSKINFIGYKKRKTE